MTPLVVDPQKLLRPLQELVLRLSQRLPVRKLLRVFDNLVKHWLILFELLLIWVIIPPLDQVFHRLSCVLVCILALLVVLCQELLCCHAHGVGRLFIDLLHLIVKLVNITPLRPQVLRHVPL